MTRRAEEKGRTCRVNSAGRGRRPWYLNLLCRKCGAGYQVSRRTVRLHWGPARFVFQDVPLLVCTKCRDMLYFPHVLRRLERRMKNHLERNTVAEFRYSPRTVGLLSSRPRTE